MRTFSETHVLEGITHFHFLCSWIGNELTLIQLMTWCRADDKPSSLSIMAQFTDIYASPAYNTLKHPSPRKYIFADFTFLAHHVLVLSNPRELNCLFNSVVRLTAKKAPTLGSASHLRVIHLWPALQKTSISERVSLSWRHSMFFYKSRPRLP